MITATREGFPRREKILVHLPARSGARVPLYLHPTLPHPDALKAYFQGYEELARAGWGFA